MFLEDVQWKKIGYTVLIVATAAVVGEAVFWQLGTTFEAASCCFLNIFSTDSWEIALRGTLCHSVH